MLNLIQHLKPPAQPEQDSGIRRNDVWEQESHPHRHAGRDPASHKYNARHAELDSASQTACTA
jgi:hypothetical protein